jgi:glycosyltransferase involved in cell wall biosynthesis
MSNRYKLCSNFVLGSLNKPIGYFFKVFSLQPQNQKVALVHEWLSEWGGAEKVLEAIHSVFPGPIYTLVKNEEVLKGSFLEGCTLHTSFIQRLPYGKTKYRNYLPLFPMAVEQFNLNQYDLVISSSYAVAKGVLTTANQLHICYCHSPIRYAWDLYHQYLQEANLASGLKGRLAKLILHYIRLWDYTTANRVDHYVANSAFIARRIRKVYNREATVIYPPVDVINFELHEPKEEYYLTASRMVPYKKISLIVEAFSQTPHRRLVVIGDGPDFNRIKAMATPNVTLLGFQPFEVLKHHLQRAKAFVFAAEEDFGIAPVEAQACGTPVLAYGRGGALETIVAGETGLFFNEQTALSLLSCVEEFEASSHSYCPNRIRKNAERFSRDRFEREFSSFVGAKLKEFYGQSGS